ncbi:MAG: hypothetical protein AAFV19_01195 [Pseudomonadota bacterium]
MTGLVYLDIAIGVIFLILIFSLFAGAILEALAAIFNIRANSVREGIRNLIGNDDDFKAFWTAPLVEAVKGPPSLFSIPGWISFGWSKIRDVIRYVQKDDSPKPGTLRRDPSDVPTKVFTRTVMRALYNQVPGSAFETDQTPENLAAFLRELRTKAKDAGDSSLLHRIGSVLDGVEADAKAVEAAIGAWYETARDRFEGWYIRRAQFLLFLIGLALAITTNTDPIRYGYELRENDALRQKVVTMAEETAALDELEDVLEHFGLDKSDSDPSNAAGLPADAQIAEIRGNVEERLKKLTEELNEISAQAGWGHCPKFTNDVAGQFSWDCFKWTTGVGATWLSRDVLNWPEPVTHQGEKIPNPVFGWILLALGVMLGSQFWLDLLRRFVSIRSAGTGIFQQSQARQTDPERPSASTP